MFERIKTGWKITKQSFRVLKADKEILMFPILSIIFNILLAFLFIIIFLFGFVGTKLVNENLINVFTIVYAFIFLCCTYFISIFFEGAIITSASIRFSGKNPSLSDGIKLPLSKIFRIFSWAVINAIVSTILNTLNNVIKNKSKGTQIAASIGTSIIGIAWALATFFVIPIILFENLSVFGSIKRSKEIFIKTWGENATAQFTTGGIFILFGFLGFIPLLISLFIGNLTLMGICLLIFLIWMMLMMIISNSIKGIIIAVLYRYASTGKMPQIYDSEVQILMTKNNLKQSLS